MKMNNNKTEQERKELNKKLLKTTFASEMKNKRKTNSVERMVQFLCLFIALLLSELIVGTLEIEFWLTEVVVSLVLVTVILFIETKIVDKIQNRKK